MINEGFKILEEMLCRVQPAVPVLLAHRTGRVCGPILGHRPGLHLRLRLPPCQGRNMHLVELKAGEFLMRH